MRRDLVDEVFSAAQDELFEDVIYTPFGGAAVTVEKSIFGIEVASARFEEYGQSVRTGTHFTRAAKAKFPNLAKGDLFNDGTVYRVVDFEPGGDGRFELVISFIVNG